VPAALIGVLGENLIVDKLGEPWQIALFLAFFGVLLWLADRTPPRRQMSELGLGQAVAVGFAQSLALMPGVSRSGITITAGRFLGLDRDAAARVSFLLLIPITFGAVAWKGVTDVLLGDLPSGSAGPFAVGVLASAAGGLVAIWGLLGYVRSHTYTVFVVFRLAMAAFILLLIAAGIREPTF
jgi:undecaprenyl-diphosphatase